MWGEAPNTPPKEIPMTNNLSQMVLKPCPCCASTKVELNWYDSDHPSATISCDDCGLNMDKGGGHWQRAYLEAEAIAAWNRRPSPNPTEDVVEAVDAFEMGFEWAMMLRGQTLEDSRAVGRTLYCDLFEPIAEQIDATIKAQGFNSFEPVEEGIGAAKRIIRAAISAMPRPSAELVEAARKALPIVESDLASAKEYADADWIGLSQEAFDALEAALRNVPDPDLGKIERGHVCKHGVRWPHACNDCDEAAWAARPAPEPQP